jgi:hypothetical protein
MTKKNLPDTREVKRRIDFVALVSCYTKLRRCGGQLVGLCPFHNEANPSFFVEPQRKIWKCFGCGRGGDIYDFVMRAERCRFHSAVRFLSYFLGDSARQRARAARERGGGRERGKAPSAREAGHTHSQYEAEHVRLVAKLAATERRLAAIRTAIASVPLACAAESVDLKSRGGGGHPLLVTEQTTGRKMDNWNERN